MSLEAIQKNGITTPVLILNGINIAFSFSSFPQSPRAS